MLLADSRSKGCPVRTGSTSEFTWLELDHRGRSCPAGVGTTEMTLCKQKEAKKGDFSPSHFPSHAQVEPNLKLAGKGAWKNVACRSHSPAVHSRAGKWRGRDSNANKQTTGTPSHAHVEVDFRNTGRETTVFWVLFPWKQCGLYHIKN